MCKFEMYMYVNSYLFVQFKFSVYGHTFRTYTCVLQCSHASVGLAQAHPNQSASQGGGNNSYNSLHTEMVCTFPFINAEINSISLRSSGKCCLGSPGQCQRVDSV